MSELEMDGIGRPIQACFSMGHQLGFLAGLLLLLVACGSADPPAPGTAELADADGLKMAEPTAVNSATETPMVNNVAASELPPQPTATDLRSLTMETIKYPADDVRIRYDGRFDFQDPKRPEFDWSGTAIELAFEGTDLAIYLEELDGINVYNVSVDGQSQVLKTEKGPGRYVLAAGLAPGEHHLRLVKRTEPVLGAVAFSGVEITGEGLLDPPAAKARRIEFVGDSITTGFGNEGESPECFFTAETQNAETTYAAMVAGELDAAYSLIAMSGLGVYYPLQLQDVSSSETAVNILDRALAFEPDVTWPPDQQTPDAVVISLGTNDYSSDPMPEDESFIEVYMGLLNEARRRYPEAFIFAAAGPLVFDPGPRIIETAVERFRATNDDERVAYVFIKDNLERSAEDFGCAWHPNVHGHQKIAAQLAPVIAAQMGW
jgi:lysophospholipase L1-like esterase